MTERSLPYEEVMRILEATAERSRREDTERVQADLRFAAQVAKSAAVQAVEYLSGVCTRLEEECPPGEVALELLEEVEWCLAEALASTRQANCLKTNWEDLRDDYGEDADDLSPGSCLQSPAEPS